MPVTIHDVARHVGVSAATVSRSFSAPDQVRARTRDAVRAAAAELGYRPNRAARSLVTGRTGTVGIVVPDLANPFFPSVVSGAQARARQGDHALLLADSGEDAAQEVELIATLSRQVDGLVLVSPRARTAALRELADGTPLVLLNRRYVGLPAVLMDSADGMRQAVEHLAGLGHRRVAYLSGPRSSWSNRQRLRGLAASAPALGIEVVHLGPLAPTFDAGVQAADQVLAAGVTAAIAFNDLMALGVLSRLTQRSVPVPVPDRLSVLGFDDIPMTAMCTPPLTSVALSTEAAGRAAVDLLLHLLGPPQAGGADARAQRRLPAQLVVRGSTGPPAGSRSRQTPQSPLAGARPGAPGTTTPAQEGIRA